MIRLLAAGLLIVLPAAPLLAQPAALQAVCAKDATALCPGVKPGGGRILACFKQKSDQLSAGCRSALLQARALR
ncbi:hypothetical protein ASE63_08445 [Bosea sp. Root381]|jgi:hypothetical protein|uniref:hypothetical protein n=1 Tax=Bosea sp. Root381 TaxID=1736524 RepID=UPI000700AAD2|nr:hypothetical protein [Bosea sp. Root381]KRE00116.1 hypothetical protein ASE63_08445 [Bosea sp. Root381]